jgi:hypothetical protein
MENNQQTIALWLFNIAMENHHRNRCFTYIRNGDFPWQTVSHNQMVIIVCGLPKKLSNSWMIVIFVHDMT